MLLGLRNDSFRNYADYLLTQEFHDGIEKLLSLADHRPTAIMCSEGLYWRCHRRLISDFLLTKGITVQHIMPAGEVVPHTLTEGAEIKDEKLTYRQNAPEKTKSLFE